MYYIYVYMHDMRRISHLILYGRIHVFIAFAPPSRFRPHGAARVPGSPRMCRSVRWRPPHGRLLLLVPPPSFVARSRVFRAFLGDDVVTIRPTSTPRPLGRSSE